MKKLLLIGIVAGAVTGCSIKQVVNPVTVTGHKEVCIIENPAVKAGFLQTYIDTLRKKGYSPRTVERTAAITACSVTSTYTANWRWDLALYMAYAEIVVYNNGAKAGDAIYDAKSGSGNLSKFIDAETKIQELVNSLFPGGPG